MTGTLINTATVIIGSSIGLMLRSRIPERVTKTIFQAIGLFTVALGISMSLKIGNFIVVIFSLIIGGVFGEGIDIDKQINGLSEKFKAKLNIKDHNFTDGLLTAFLLFCMGVMTILGAFEEGINGDSTLIITKAVMDGFSSVALAAALGIGVLFSAALLLLFQGSLTIAAMYLGEFLTESSINELTAVGGILLIGLGINILNIKEIKIFNLLPALIFAVLFDYLRVYIESVHWSF